MININDLKIEDLKDISTANELKELVQEFCETNNVDEAKDLLIILHKLYDKESGFAKEYHDLDQLYQKMMVKLKFLALHTLPVQEISKLIRHHLLVAIGCEIDMFDRIDLLAILYRDRQLGDEIRKNMVSAMVDNTERIGQSPIQREGGEQEPPYIKNWLKDFARYFPSDRRLGNLEKVEYLNNSTNARTLQDEQKEQLRQVMNIYTYLRFPPTEQETVEETGHGKTEPVKTTVLKTPPTPVTASKVQDADVPSLPELMPIEKLKNEYRAFQINKERILQEEDAVSVQTKGDQEAIKKRLAQAAREGKKYTAAACLKLLARQGALITALRDNKAWFEAVSQYIIDRYSSQLGLAEVRKAVASLKNDPTKPSAISEFLQYLLKEKLKYGEHESALMAIDIAHQLPEAYQNMAYGNSETGQFEWAENVIENGKLAVKL